MKLAVSNIAWSASEEAAVVQVLQREGATGIEIAPTKWREQPYEASAADIAEYRASWEHRGLPIIAMQSLLFGRPELQLFADADSRSALIGYLRRVIDLGAALGAGALVFGSPRNRRRGELAPQEATAIAIDFLREIGEHAFGAGVKFCLEPVPERYGCDFVQTPAEALALCEAVDHPGIAVNADLGAMILADDDPRVALSRSRRWTGHFHASEPDFVPLVDAAAHERAAAALRQTGYDGWVSVEMTAAAAGSNAARVEQALRLAKSAYR